MSGASEFGAGGGLVWTQPKVMRRAYELKKGEELVGEMRFEKSCGSLASAQIGEERWTFKREGFLHPRVTVRGAKSGANVAVFHPSWSGTGVLEYVDGRRVRWRNTNFWRSDWSFLGEDEKAMVHFRNHGGFMKISANVEIEPENTGMVDLPMLAALGWYLMLLTAEDASAVAVSVAAIS
jgi:hypothetical protein